MYVWVVYLFLGEIYNMIGGNCYLDIKKWK